MIRTVKTKYGILEGVESNAGYALFRGVPYARPPVGDLRWRAPEEPESWEGIKVCDTYGDACMQYDRWEDAVDDITDDSGHPYILKENYPYPPRMSEDCLYLNIYTPAKDPDERLPVLFYIHGGGFQQWYGSDYEYCGDRFCEAGCILVSITYRLNVFGFFTHPDLAKESGYDASGNYGILDQIAALKWVYENIRGFGGDPQNITVFGQSAGGEAARALWCSPLSRDYVNRVSIQSSGGIGTLLEKKDRKSVEKMGEDFMESLGCESIEEMRKLPAEVLRDANDKLGFFRGFSVYTDGYVFEKDIDELLAKGEAKDVEVIVGCTADEGGNEKEPMFGVDSLAHALALAEALRRNGKKRVYTYVFDQIQPGDDAGVPHSCDNRYQFGTLDGSWRPYTEEDYSLSAKMTAYWANFARCGDPAGEGEEKWFSYQEKEEVMRLSGNKCSMTDYAEKKKDLRRKIDEILNHAK